MTPKYTITIEGVEYDLVRKFKKEWEIVEFDYWFAGTTCRYKRHSKEDYYWQGASMFPFAWFKSENITIHSVKRLIDGETFKVGDEIEDGKIKSIVIRPINPESIVEQCWIDCSGQCGTDLMYADKVPPRKVERDPLFTTIDEVKIYEGDPYFSVSDNFELLWTSFAKKSNIDAATKRAFSTEEKAKEYVTLNKPFMSVQDVMNRLNAYFIPSSRIPAFDNIKAFAQQKINQ